MDSCMYVLLITALALLPNQSNCDVPFPVPLEPNCDRVLPTEEELEAEDSPFYDALQELDPGGDVPTFAAPDILELNYTCLAQGLTRDQYRALSVIAIYVDVLFLDRRARHFQLICFDGEWILPISPIYSFDYFQLPTDDPLDTRFDCRNCVGDFYDLNDNRCLRMLNRATYVVYICTFSKIISTF